MAGRPGPRGVWCVMLDPRGSLEIEIVGSKDVGLTVAYSRARVSASIPGRGIADRSVSAENCIKR